MPNDRWSRAGDGLGSLLFSLGLDELLTAVREAMRDLSVDSNMIGQVVHVVGSVDGRLESGAVVPITDDLPLTLSRHQHMLRSMRSRRRREERCGSRSGLDLPQTRRLTSPWWPRGG